LVRKFLVEIEEEAFKELAEKLNDYYFENTGEKLFVENDTGDEIIRDLFYVELGMHGCIDVRDKVKVKEVKSD